MKRLKGEPELVTPCLEAACLYSVADTCTDSRRHNARVVVPVIFHFKHKNQVTCVALSHTTQAFRRGPSRSRRDDDIYASLTQAGLVVLLNGNDCDSNMKLSNTNFTSHCLIVCLNFPALLKLALQVQPVEIRISRVHLSFISCPKKAAPTLAPILKYS